MNDLVANSQSTAVRCCLDFLNSRRILVGGTFSLHYELRFISMCGGGGLYRKSSPASCTRSVCLRVFFAGVVGFYGTSMPALRGISFPASHTVRVNTNFRIRHNDKVTKLQFGDKSNTTIIYEW